MRRIVPLLLLASLALSAAGASPAQANPQSTLSIMMDDDLLIYRGDEVRDQTLKRMKALGVDYVRVTVLWSVVADGMKKSKRRRADQPSAYPKANWDKYDRLVRAGKTLGIGIYFNVTGAGPKWVMGKPPKSQRKYANTWKPNPREFGKFVKAVGTRYDGTRRDENDKRAKLPRVSFWTLYNEPNQAGWLTPQWKGKIPWSPVLYRDLWYHGRRGLDASGHREDIVMIGETAPLGTNNTNPPSPIYPKKFIREFFCVDSRNNRYTGAAARRRKCSTLKRIQPLRYLAWAHHPYTKRLGPTKRDPDRNAITMANIGELPQLLQNIGARRDPTAALNLAALTEFGYETNPPDPFSGISPAKQAADINVGDYLAYKDPRVIANTQFLLTDVKGVSGFPKSNKKHWFTYQSGLFYRSGKPKPAAASYRLPLVLTARSGSTASFWGWLRFLPTGTKTEVQMQFRPAGAPAFQNAGSPVKVTNPAGFFETTQPAAGPGTWRAAFIEPFSKTAIISRDIATSG